MLTATRLQLEYLVIASQVMFESIIKRYMVSSVSNQFTSKEGCITIYHFIRLVAIAHVP